MCGICLLVYLLVCIRAIYPQGISCDFDTDECGFIQGKYDKFDWTRHRGSTPSRRTGPRGDQTSGKGYYMYMEATGRSNGDNAKMYTTVSLTGNSCLSFYGYLYGSDKGMGSLKVTLDGHAIFAISGNQGKMWHHFEEIPLPGKGDKLLVLEAIRGESYRSDMAVDDIAISDCEEPQPQPSTHPSHGHIASPQTLPPTLRITRKPIDCGISSVGRIVGGTDAVRGEWPWQAMLRSSSGVPYCGGTLVAHQWVVTAAHCVEATSAGPVFVRLGAIRRLISVGGEQDFKATKVIIHPDYNKPKIYAHDIALLKLDKMADLTDPYVNAACLPDRLPVPREGLRCWITGWGRMSSTGPAPDILQQVSVPIAAKTRCDVAYPNMLHDSMICAGVEQGGIDACQGDSGGPMVCQGGDGSFYLQGVTSWGHGCAVKGKFGIYAKVKYLMGWINKEMVENRSPHTFNNSG